jgi:diacylglycerol kinase (ATP)
VGRVTYRDAAGRSIQRYFLNVAAVGLAGDVAIAVRRRGKLLGGRLTYLVEAVRTIARGRPRPMQLVVDGHPEPPASYHLVALANTSTFGGGMRVAPWANPADGWLDLVTVGAVSRGQLFRLLARAARAAMSAVQGSRFAGSGGSREPAMDRDRSTSTARRGVTCR